MPFSLFEQYAAEQVRHEAAQMADMITAVNLGTNGKVDDIKKTVKALRGG